MAKKFNIETGKFEEVSPLKTINVQFEPGKDGVDGKDGADGKDGKDGTNGKDGKDGLNGKDGIDGKDGIGIQSINQPLPNKIEIKLTNDESRFLDLPKGADGKEVEFRSANDQIDWRYKDGEWIKLFTIPRPVGGSGGGSRKVKDLRDVTITDVTDGQVLSWSSSAQAWVNGAGGSGGTITTQDEGITLSSSVTTLNFVGAGVTASGAGATTTITVSGGGGGATEFIDLTDVPASYTGESLKVVRVNAGETGLEFATVSGTGDVVGPASATDNAITRYDGTTGKLIQNSAVTIEDTGATTITSSAAAAVAIGPNGATNPVLQIDGSIASQATGLSVTGRAAGAGVTLAAISSGANENISLNSKGSSTASLNGGTTVAMQLGGTNVVASTASQVNITNTTRNATTNTAFLWTGIASGTGGNSLTAGSEVHSAYFNLGATQTHGSNTAITTLRQLRINPSTEAFQTATGTITNGAGVGIDGAPIAGTNAAITNSSALLISGRAVGAGVTNSYGLNVAPNTGATNNYAARFDGAIDLNGAGAGTSGQVLTSGGAGAPCTWSTASGSGDVSKVGTPVNNQVGVWTGDGTIEGDTSFTFDTATDRLSVTTSGIVETGTIELGAASDTTISRTGAGDIAVEGNAIYRAGGTDVPIADGGTGASTASAARVNLGVMNIVVLASDQTNNNAVANTMQDITGLEFAVTAGETYYYHFVMDVTTAATTTGFRFSVNGPAATRLNYRNVYPLTTTSQTIIHGSTTYNNPAASNATSASTAGNIAVVEGFVTPSASGTFIGRFASEVASSAVTVKAGSILEWYRCL